MKILSSSAKWSLFSIQVLVLNAAFVQSQHTHTLQVENESGVPIDIYWIDPQTKEGSPLTEEPFSHGHGMNFNTFTGHEFGFRESPNEAGVCGSDANGGSCRGTSYVVVDNILGIRINKKFEIEIAKPPPVEEEKYVIPEFEPVQYNPYGSTETLALSACQEKSKTAVKTDTLSSVVAATTLEELISCVESNVTQELMGVSGEVVFQSETRAHIAERFENYTCADEDMPTSPALYTKKWIKGGIEREVNVLHERDASKIHVVKNFISPEECLAMEEAARPKLHKATVANGSGGSELSPNRKAMQAGIKVDWSKEAEGDHIAVLSRRVYDYANWVTGLGIEEHGQEDLMSIQYEGRGDDDGEPDRYMPHCDGDCTGLKHKPATRIATMVMYCVVPEKGGATNFRNSGLHVVPEVGSATFFSYMSPDRIMDKAFTEHSGCPVIKGEKKIVTQWIRLGVDKENPWDSFNTLGIKYSEEDKN
eukprot:CAMPEP_0195522144 /NCGR_PEP_ID=MMETSP0794_2-20130614/20067_1 /TAXON_ID=515487 /ORGANISM="Stephanopyxis turris, Strain CCMP 815" /LENGTH=477 /DNA_ID=CAMNT_0040651835 /DNA_START=42 /DNA_END=1475 /DNA_ORIENTATION=+